jgi:hypothetical protein
MPSLAALFQTPRRLWAAPPEVRRFVLRAWGAAPLVEASLGLLGLAKTLRWVEWLPTGAKREGAVDVAAGERLVGAAYRAHLLRGACLPRSLTQYLLHRRDGLAARFVVGVRSDAPGVRAHAWVESPESPAPDRGFAPILHRITDAEVAA